MKKFIIIILILLISSSVFLMAGCDNDPDVDESCYMGSFTCKGPRKMRVTDSGRELPYCEKHRTECYFCNGEVTASYTNMMDFLIFVCENHSN